MSWLKKRRRKHLISSSFPAEWLSIIQRNVPYYKCRTAEDQSELQKLIQIFLGEKNLRALVDAVINNHPSLLDRYGAASPAEFFAVATEFFFEKPNDLKSVHPDLYEQLMLFYQRDPAHIFENARAERICRL